MAEIDLEKLKVPVSGIFKLRFAIRMAFQKLVYRVPFLGKALRFIGYRMVLLGNLDKEEAARLASIKLLHNDKADAGEFGSSYGYNDQAAEFMVTAKYWQHLQSEKIKSEPGESWMLYQEAIKEMDALFSADKQIKNFVNFGVCYAHIDAALAQRHPDIHFIGLDRSKYTKIFNEDNFSHFKNMDFLAQDIFDFLKDKQFSDGVFFHARTLVYLPMHFIQRLYQAVQRAGFRYIVGFEQVGVSRETFKVYEFSRQLTPSVLFRNNFFIHNYPALLEEAGYRLQTIDLLKTNHPHEDYRFLKFVAQPNLIQQNESQKVGVGEYLQKAL